MAFRCIIHLEKHDAIGEGVSGWRFNAVNGAYDALCKKVRGDALPTMHAAYDEALRLSRRSAKDCVVSSMPELGFSILIERCNAPLT